MKFFRQVPPLTTEHIAMNDDNIKQPDTHPAQSGDVDAVAAAIKLAGRREVPPQNDRDRIFNVAAATLQQKLARRKRQRRIGLAVAASLVLAVTATLGLLMGTADPDVYARADRVIGTLTWQADTSAPWIPISEGKMLPENSLLKTGPTDRAGLILHNGISVRLAPDTTVELVAASALRLDHGTVYIDAGDDAETSIELITPVGTARDIGTQFEVRYTADQYRLRIREGKVSLAMAGQHLNASTGDELYAEAGGAVNLRRLASNEQDWLWAEELAPVPDLDGQPLTLLLNWVSRETGRGIAFASDDVETQAAETILHGSVRKMSPLDTLGAMLSTTDLRYLLQEDGTILIFTEG